MADVNSLDVIAQMERNYGHLARDLAISQVELAAEKEVSAQLRAQVSALHERLNEMGVPDEE